MRNTILLLTLLCLFASNESYAAKRSETFLSNGYVVIVAWEQLHGRLLVDGMVEGATGCQQLNVSVLMQNSAEPGFVYLEDAIYNYKPKTYRRYESGSTVRQERRNRKHWHVSDVFVGCLE